MKSFLFKLFGVLALSALAGYLIIQKWLGAVIFAFLPIVLYFPVYKLSQLIRKLSFDKKALPEESTEADGFIWKDLNKNGKLDVYEDKREPIEKRIEDLLQKMGVREKAGLMFSPQMDVVGKDKIFFKGGFVFGGNIAKQIQKNKINTFCCMGSLPPKEFAMWQNEVQKLASKTRLGIPVTLCSDPRHVYVKNTNPLATQKDDGMSAFPTSLGMSAANDLSLMEKYGEIVAKELCAVGIRFALHPCADTATEPRWPRAYETFGDNAEKNGKFAKAYISAMQGENISSKSVACCVKHFPGGGPQKDGDDPHFAFGKEQVYPANRFAEHLRAFRPAIESGVAAVMPYYGVPKGLDGIEEVGFNFNKNVVTDILRKELNFEGIVHTDYSIIEGIQLFGIPCVQGRAWGVESLSYDERLIKALDAGVDQFGGENCSKRLARLVKKGMVSEERLNLSCRKILRLKFALGLFDNPYVDENAADKICKTEEHVRIADAAMRKSLVLLKKDALPLKRGIKLYSEGFSEELVEKYAQPVSDLEKADFALIRLDVPKSIDNRDPLASMFESGSLKYSEEEKAHFKEIMQTVPSIFVINMNRPAVITEFKEGAKGIIAEFNTKPEILLDAVFGVFSPSGVLPYSLPENEDILKTHNSDEPLKEEECAYFRDFGLTY